MYLAIIVGQFLLAFIWSAFQVINLMDLIIRKQFGDDFDIKESETYLYEIGFSTATELGQELNKNMKLILLADVITLAAVSFL